MYALAGRRQPAGVLVLTNDIWNARMSSIGGVLVALTGAVDPLSVRLGSTGGLALPSLVMSLPRPMLGDAFYRSTPAELHAVEAALKAVLALDDLTQTPPRPPGGPAGPILGPAWGQIYYGPPIAGQKKRYVVVSHDVHNATTGRVLAVRTTSRTKRDSVSFPLIQSRRAQACCGELSLLTTDLLEWQPHHGRPGPSALDLDDMVAVARGVAQTHGLGEISHEVGDTEGALNSAR